MHPKHQPWTADEDGIIVREYPDRGAVGCHALLPGRTVKAISQRASQRGIRTYTCTRPYKPPQEAAPAAIGHLKIVTSSESPQFRTAASSPTLERVPDRYTDLPWTKCPRDPGTARSLAAILESAVNEPVVVTLGKEAVAFFETHAAYLRALATRTEEQAEHPRAREPVRKRKFFGDSSAVA